MGERELERVEQHTWSFVARQLRQVFRLAWTIGGIARNWKSINPPDKKKEPFPEESTIKLNADEITKKNNSRPY